MHMQLKILIALTVMADKSALTRKDTFMLLKNYNSFVMKMFFYQIISCNVI